MPDRYDRDYCPSCWDRLDRPAPVRCMRAINHLPASAVEVGIVIKLSDGTKTYIASDNFAGIELDFQKPEFHPYWDSQYMLPTTDTTIVMTISGVKKYTMIARQETLPGLEMGDIIDLGEKG